MISSYACDHMTADAEFLLSKAKYRAVTGREQRRDADVLCYQIRQAFKPGEITPEEANRIGYETAMRWTKGKVYNLKQMAAALMFLQEHQLTEYDQLAAQANEAAQRFHALAGELRQTEDGLSKTSALMETVVQYAKSRPVFEGYKAARYSKKYLAEHGPELADYRAAKAALNELLDGEKLPKMDALKEKRRKLAARKKALYAEYRAAQQEMREAVAVKANIDHLLGLSDERKNKEQER